MWGCGGGLMLWRVGRASNDGTGVSVCFFFVKGYSGCRISSLEHQIGRKNASGELCSQIFYTL